MGIHSKIDHFASGHQELSNKLDCRGLVEDGAPLSVWVDARRNVEHWIVELCVVDVMLDIGSSTRSMLIDVCVVDVIALSVDVDVRIIVCLVVAVVMVVCHICCRGDSGFVDVGRHVDRHVHCHGCRVSRRVVVRGT